MKKVLHKLISPFQAAFVPGRWIAEGTVLAQEVVHKIRRFRGKGGIMALKVDMSKAYDRLEWPFIEQVLLAHGFGRHFVDLVMFCVKTVSFQVLVNGSPFKTFVPSRGIRQGDPMSPYLFILCSEVLSGLLRIEEEKSMLHGIRIARNSPPISHLMFADDTLLFCRANTAEVESLEKCLSTYATWSGQLLNNQKSTVLFPARFPSNKKKEITDALAMPEMGKGAVYLGNPLLLSNSRCKDFDFLKAKILKRIESWKSKLLSRVGRNTLISSVLSSIPVYSMSTFNIPNKICNDIDATLRRFWWKGSVESPKSLCTISWDSICLPKNCGGLGLRKMKEFNIALLSKLAWKMATEKDNLCVKVLSSKYCSNDPFWECRSKASDSTIWKAILQTRDLIRKGSCYLIGDGDSINIWTFPWIPWEVNGEPEANFDELSQPRPHSSRSSENNSVWIKLWKSTLHERMKFLLWRILRNALPTRAVLAKRIKIDSSCSLCGNADETTLHLFKECPVARAAWFHHAGLRIDCIPSHDFAEFFTYLVQEESLQQDKSSILLLGCICNFIWKVRNEMAIKDLPVQVQRISLELRLALLEFSSSLTRKKQCQEEHRIKATPVILELDAVGVQEAIVSVDASFKEGKAGLAVCLTVNGVDLFCAEVTEAANPLEAELMTIVLAFQVAKQRDINSISIKSDCQVAIKALSLGVPPPDWQALAAFLNCFNLSSSFNRVTFVWISRSCNLVADAISRWILQSNRVGSFVSTELPIFVASRIASI